jgi:hypothetical protein
MAERLMKELDFIMLVKPVDQIPPSAYEFIFPLAIFEERGSAVLLMPMQAAEQIITNLGEMMPRIGEEVAYVSVPYHPDEGEDDASYSFGVYIAWIGSDESAIGEALLLSKYASRLWQKYRHLAKPFDMGGAG